MRGLFGTTVLAVVLVSLGIAMVIFDARGGWASRLTAARELNPSGLTFSTYFGEQDPYERTEEGVVLEGPTEVFNGSMELVTFRSSAQPAPYYDAALVAKADRIKPGERIRCRAARIYVNHGARGWQHVFGCERIASNN